MTASFLSTNNNTLNVVGKKITPRNYVDPKNRNKIDRDDAIREHKIMCTASYKHV